MLTATWYHAYRVYAVETTEANWKRYDLSTGYGHTLNSNEKNVFINISFVM